MNIVIETKKNQNKRALKMPKFSENNARFHYLICKYS